MTHAAVAQTDEELSRGLLVAYGAPALASSFLFTAVSLYLLKYSTDVLLMAPATMGLIFGISRFWDALTDPLVGNLSDRTNTTWGRRRPWMIASAIPVALTYYAVWAPPAGLEGNSLTLWMGASIILFYTAITVFSVPYTALGAELSADHHDRTRVFGAKAIGDQLGVIAGAVLLLIMEQSAAPRTVAACASLVAGAMMVGGIGWAVAVLREPSEHRGRAGRQRPYADFGDVLRNRRARTLVAVFFLEMLGYNALVTMLPYVTEYVLETPGQTAYYLFCAIAATLATIPAWIWLSRRFGKVEVWTAALVVKVFVFAGLFFVGSGQWMFIGAITLVFGAMNGASAVLGPSLKADTVDSDEAETGERREGTFFAVWGFAIKAAIGFSIVLSGIVLSATGFRPGIAQTPEALFGIRMVGSVFPLLCHIAAIPLLRSLDLDEGVHAQLRDRIQQRRAAENPISTRPSVAAGAWPTSARAARQEDTR